MSKKLVLLFGFLTGVIMTYALVGNKDIEIINTVRTTLLNTDSLSDFLGNETVKNDNEEIYGYKKNISELPDFRPEIVVKDTGIDELVSKEKQALISDDKDFQKKISHLAAQYNNNLSDIELRNKLEARLKKNSIEYKNTALKLAKDQIARDNKSD